GEIYFCLQHLEGVPAILEVTYRICILAKHFYVAMQCAGKGFDQVRVDCSACVSFFELCRQIHIDMIWRVYDHELAGFLFILRVKVAGNQCREIQLRLQLIRVGMDRRVKDHKWMCDEVGSDMPAVVSDTVRPLRGFGSL